MTEYGLDSLLAAGFIKLDAAGKRELEAAKATRLYGHPGVHWTLTSAGAKRLAPYYCANLGKHSDFQAQAVKDMLAANQESIKRGRAK